MVAGQRKMLEGIAVRAQLVSRHRLRRETLLAEQLAHELDGCGFVPSALNQDFENSAFMVVRIAGKYMYLWRAVDCCAANRMRTRIASPENVPQTSSVASPPVFPLPH
jgi:hypothetical protein